jgi:hypothetical protein
VFFLGYCGVAGVAGFGGWWHNEGRKLEVLRVVVVGESYFLIFLIKKLIARITVAIPKKI